MYPWDQGETGEKQGNASMQSIVLQRIHEWAERSIDLTPRNPLLHSNVRRRRLSFLRPSLDETWNFLQDETSLVLVPDNWDERSHYLSAQRTGEKDSEGEEWLIPILTQSRWKKYPRAYIGLSARLLYSSLVRLRRRVVTIYQDAGFWTLFLAFGLLRWTPASRTSGRLGSEVWESPLVLLPVMLEQEAPGEPFLLSPRQEEEVQFNVALRVYLEKVERVSLPEVDPENLTETLETIARAVQSRGWTLDRVCWLGLFSFHKMAIYRDLQENANLISQHPIVQALAGFPFPDLNVTIGIEKHTLDTRPSEEIATVLPADSSQLVAILRAREGSSFWIHGPPGTGKSQTIVNIIADALRRGKTVLFVSEKRAALEVVLRRLRDVGLEPFCLDLHNYRIRRGEAVKSIAQELWRGWETGSYVSDRLLAELDERRQALAGYAKAVHTPRSPLNRTPYEVIGRVSRLPEVHTLGEIRLDVTHLTETELQKVIDLTRHLAFVADLAHEGPAFPWWGVQVDVFSEQTRAELLNLVQNLKSSLRQLIRALNQICGPFGLRPPNTVEQAKAFHHLLTIFQTLPPLPSTWTGKRNVQPWLDKSKKALLALRRFVEMREKLSSAVHVHLLLPEEDTPLSFRDIKEIHEAVKTLSSGQQEKIFDQPVAFLLDHRLLLSDLRNTLEQAWRWADDFRSHLGLDCCTHILDIERSTILAIPFTRDLFLEPEWFQAPPEMLEKAQYFLSALAEWKALRQRLLQDWKESFFELEGQEALNIWQNRFRRLRPSYHRLERLLRASCRNKEALLPDRISKALHDLEHLQKLQASLNELQQDSELCHFLGRYFAGLETNFEEASAALDLAQRIQEAFVGLPLKVRKLLSGQVEIDDRLRTSAKALLQAWNDWQDAVQQLKITEEALVAAGSSIATLVQGLQKAEEALEILYRHVNSLANLLRSPLNFTFLQDLSSVVEDLYRCLEAREWFHRFSIALSREWGWAPEATPEAWEEAVGALEVWSALVSKAKIGPAVPVALSRAAQHPEERPTPQPLEEVLCKWEETLKMLAQRLPEPKVDGIPLEMAPFARLFDHFQSMERRVEDVQRYLDFRLFKEQLAERLSWVVVEDLLTRRDLSPKELPEAVERLILAKWLDHIFASDPVLKSFRWDRHQQYLKEFRQLDKDLEKWAVSRVVYTLTERRHELIESHPEVQLLLKEAKKRRRHRPIRRIIREAFHTILRVKPCWLMSPLSVSYFLLPEHQFDLVIFDEASQVRPEDALPAVYRAKQVVICGDPQQLPPTTFFDARVLDFLAREDELEEENDLDSGAIGESILELLEGKLPSVFLQWHYRSEDEKLIAFSNHNFYHNRLITFPTPEAPNLDTGIEYKYVPNGIYERSASRINRAEVEEVCRQVLEHLNRWGQQRSLGVVAMNEPQRNAILDELERRTRQNPQLRVLWDDEKWKNGESFFVKNLEAVQGDERDVIIISTTYGKGHDGRLTMQFGPLTHAGGERRLNVLVTRARKKIVLVTSLQPEDIRLSDGVGGEGLRVLRNYLQYAAQGGELPFVGERESRKGYESDFEAAVADTLRSWGYRVIPQYGVGPYRIDLVVCDPQNPSLQVAVECDGATYHRLPTVRERDRIRQEWLERRGWKVVRVWSTDWWYQRKRAEERLRKEIEEALRQKRTNSQQTAPVGQQKTNVVTLKPTLPPAAPDLRSRLLLKGKVEIYSPKRTRYIGRPRVADPADPSTIRKVDEISPDELEALVRVSAEALAPCGIENLIREVTYLLGFRRTGKRIRQHLQSVIDRLIATGVLFLDSDRTKIIKVLSREQ